MKERLVSALLGIMFLLVFQPFPLPESGLRRWLMIGLLCLIAVICVFATELIIRYVLRMPNDMKHGEAFIRRRNLIFQVINVLLLSVAFSYFNAYCLGQSEMWFDYRCFFTVLIYMIFISFVIGLYWRGQYRSRFLQQQLNEMVFINGVLEERKRQAEQKAQEALSTVAEKAQYGNTEVDSEAASSDSAQTSERQSVAESASADPIESQPITLVGATKESLTLLPKDLLYAESEGNYVNIHFSSQGLPRIATLRITIRQIEEMLVNPNGGMIRRCHRAFIVNLQQVDSVKYENHGMQLQLRVCHTSVPVSQTYKADIRQMLVNPNC